MRKTALYIWIMLLASGYGFADVHCTIFFSGNANNIVLKKENGDVSIKVDANPFSFHVSDPVEPYKVKVIDLKSDREITFYAEKGDYSIIVDTASFTAFAQHSALNTAYFQFVHLHDSLQHQMGMGSILYDWALQHTSSYVCFDFIDFAFQNHDTILARDVFQKLNEDLFAYPAYKKYQAAFGNSTVSKSMKAQQLKGESFPGKTILKIIGKDCANYQLRVENEIIIDTVKPVNIIIRTLREPLKVTLINANDTLVDRDHINYINFFLDTGVNDITVNLDKGSFTSKSSALVRTNNEFWQLKKKYDKLRETVPPSKNTTPDSLLIAYHREYYRKCLQYPASYISLEFVNFLTLAYAQVGISKQETIKLFDKLDTRLHQFPLYQTTKEMIQHLRNSNPVENINKPMWH